jgi:hypothetical protein
MEMFRSVRAATLLLAGLAVLPLLSGCQKTSSTDSTIKVDTFVESTTTPGVASADGPGTGKTYRIVRGNNQPDDILEYDWHTAFNVTVKINNHATDDSIKLSFPVTLSSASIKVQQASGGIVNPPTGGDTEHYEYVSSASGNTIGAVNGAISLNFDVWYDLPSLRREALITVTLNFTDDSSTPKTFTKTVNVQVAP